MHREFPAHTDTPPSRKGWEMQFSPVPGGEKLKYLLSSQSDNHSRFTDWGNFSDCLETRVETMGLMWAWGILLQNVPQVNSLQFSGCYWLLQNTLWSGIPGPSQPYYTLIAMTLDSLPIWVSWRSGNKERAFLCPLYLCNALKFTKLANKPCLILTSNDSMTAHQFWSGLNVSERGKMSRGQNELATFMRFYCEPDLILGLSGTTMKNIRSSALSLPGLWL